MPDRFDLGCSPVVFDTEKYTLISQSGHRLQALLGGTVSPRHLGESYFVRCIREDADYDSHQCLEAEAWRKMIERREFELLNPPPGPGRTWVRPHELQPGVVLTADPARPLLLTRGVGVEYRGHPHVEYRLARQFPWRRADHDGWWRQVLNLSTGKLEEFAPPPARSPTDLGIKWQPVRDPWGLDLPDRRWATTALNDPPRPMFFVWQNSPDDEMLITDADTGETFHIPPNQVASGATWRVHPYTPVRVQFWDGRPVWVWGPA
ncbi:MAG: hypothetical protein U0804_13815 [Gemmataceae bacterium]